MEVLWSVPAAEDLERICAWIERDNPEAARRVARIIYDGCAQLKDFPAMGRISNRMSGRRELAFPPLPYVAASDQRERRRDLTDFPRSAGLAVAPHAFS